MARTSSSENPLAMRPIIVEGSSPVRKACIAAMISPDLRPKKGGTGVSTLTLVAWQPEHEDAPGGGSAPAALAQEMRSASAKVPTPGARTRFAVEGGDPLT